MRELIAKANEAILDAQCLRRQGRLLRSEASVLAIQLGETVQRETSLMAGLRDVATDALRNG